MAEAKQEEKMESVVGVVDVAVKVAMTVTAEYCCVDGSGDRVRAGDGYRDECLRPIWGGNSCGGGEKCRDSCDGGDRSEDGRESWSGLFNDIRYIEIITKIKRKIL